MSIASSTNAFDSTLHATFSRHAIETSALVIILSLRLLSEGFTSGLLLAAEISEFYNGHLNMIAIRLQKSIGVTSMKACLFACQRTTYLITTEKQPLFTWRAHANTVAAGLTGCIEVTPYNTDEILQLLRIFVNVFQFDLTQDDR